MMNIKSLIYLGGGAVYYLANRTVYLGTDNNKNGICAKPTLARYCYAQVPAAGDNTKFKHLSRDSASSCRRSLNDIINNDLPNINLTHVSDDSLPNVVNFSDLMGAEENLPSVEYKEVSDDVSAHLVLNEISHCESRSSSSSNYMWDHTWDGRKAADEKKVRTLIFVRAVHDDDGMRERDFQGLWVEDFMTRTGQRLAETFRTESGHTVSKLMSSTMGNAQASTKIITTRLGIHPDWVERSDCLREGYPCKPEPSMLDHPNPVSQENMARDRYQMEAAFRQIFHRPHPTQFVNHSIEIYVCHAAIISYFTMRALQLPPAAWGRFKIATSSITEFDIQSDGEVFVNTIGETLHQTTTKPV